MPRCLGTKGNKIPCQRIVGASQKYCYAHDPAFAADRKRSASRAGKAGGRGRRLLEVDDIALQLQAIVDKVLKGDLDRGTGSVAGQLLNFKRAAISTALDVKRTTELEDKMTEIEERLSYRNGRGI
jgi:hypothetical protein